MYQSHSPDRRRPAFALGLGVLLTAGLAGCMSTAERRHVNFQEDASTCAAFGSDPGSRAYSDCMLAQQRRRDVRQLESLERTRLLSEIARDAQIMTERARRERCRRDPERDECN